MALRLIYRNNADPMKNEGARVVTTLFAFSNAQGQLTRQSVVGSGRNTNLYKIL